MKKLLILIWCISGTLLLFQACTKEKLVTVNEPLELDENSPQYQRYLAERAINFIKLYRFDKLGNTIDRITDPGIKAEVTALYNEYRKRAEEEALFYVTPANDTLYFIPSIAGKPEAQTALNINFTPIVLDAQNQRNLINTRGTLQGFKIFPNMEDVGFMNPLATGLKDLEYMPKLKSFSWDKMPDFMEAAYPDEDVRTPTKLNADFSKNGNLETLTLNYIDIADMKFPTHKLKVFLLNNNSVFNTNESLDGLAADNVTIYAVSDRPDLVLKAKMMDSLKLSSSVTHLDVSESDLLKLDITGAKKLTLNPGLKKLILNGQELAEKPVLPSGLEELSLTNYGLNDKDFSAASSLKSFEILGDISNTGLILSASLEHILLGYGAKTGSMDYSSYTNLKAFTINGSPDLSEMPRLPSSVATIDFNGFNISATNPTLDLIHLTNIDFLRIFIFSTTPVTLKLPHNLIEQAVQAGYGGVNEVRGSIILPPGSVIENAQDWLSDYVYIGNIF